MNRSVELQIQGIDYRFNKIRIRVVCYSLRIGFSKLCWRLLRTTKNGQRAIAHVPLYKQLFERSIVQWFAAKLEALCTLSSCRSVPRIIEYHGDLCGQHTSHTGLLLTIGSRWPLPFLCIQTVQMWREQAYPLPFGWSSSAVWGNFGAITLHGLSRLRYRHEQLSERIMLWCMSEKPMSFWQARIC